MLYRVNNKQEGSFEMFLCHHGEQCRRICPTTQNDAGEFVDFLILCKCSASSHTVNAKDCASIEIIADLVETTGRMTERGKDNAICGSIRQMGESDESLNRLTNMPDYMAP